MLVLSVFIAACSGTPKQHPLPELRSGTSGLEFEFLKNAPPAVVFEGSEFPSILRVKNIGAYSIEEDLALLTLGIERDYTKKVKVEVGGRVATESSGDIKNEASFTLPGKTLINAKGEEEIVSFTIEPSKIDPQSETHPTTLIATLCYPYETELITSSCIDPDPNNIRPTKKSCTVQDTTFSQGQGAPVAITVVQPQMIPSENQIKPQFLITIENKGKGEVIKPGLYKSICRGSSTGMDTKELNRIGMRAWLSDQELVCSLREDSPVASATLDTQPSSDGFVRLQSNKEVVRCFYPDSARVIPKSTDSYTTQLTIQLDYGYVESKATEYTIRKVNAR